MGMRLIVKYGAKVTLKDFFLNLHLKSSSSAKNLPCKRPSGDHNGQSQKTVFVRGNHM